MIGKIVVNKATSPITIAELKRHCYGNASWWDDNLTPDNDEAIYRLIIERMVFERDTVVPAAQKWCKKWGVTLLTPEEIYDCKSKIPKEGVGVVSDTNGEYYLRWRSGGAIKERNLHIFPKFYICSAVTGQRLSNKFSTDEDAKKAIMGGWWASSSQYKGVPLVVSGEGLPWEISPSAWTQFENVSTVQELVQAVLSFPGDWEDVSRAFSHHPLAERFSVVVGIAYSNYNAVEHGVVVDNPKSSRGGTRDLFVWDHTTGLTVKGVSKNGVQWDTTKYSGKVNTRQLYYVREDDGTIGLRLEKPEGGDGLVPVTLEGNNLPEPFAKGATSGYGKVTPMQRIDQDLNERWPLSWGFRWVGGEPTANQAENYFRTLEEKPEQLWLFPNDCEAVEMGKKIVCRERGGFQTIEVKEIAKNSKKSWVRGSWSNSYYLPVEEFLADMPTIEDIAARRKVGNPEFQGSLN